MTEKATSRVPVSPEVLEALNTLKEHPRETHNDVLKRLIENAKALQAQAN